MASVISINISDGGIPKLPVDSCEVSVDGLVGDGKTHKKHETSLRAVSLFDKEILDQLVSEGYEIIPGSIGENFTVENLHVQTLQTGDRLSFEGGLLIELVEPRKPCFVLDAIDSNLKKDIVGRCGFLARVIDESTIKNGASISILLQSSS